MPIMRPDEVEEQLRVWRELDSKKSDKAVNEALESLPNKLNDRLLNDAEDLKDGEVGYLIKNLVAESVPELTMYLRPEDYQFLAGVLCSEARKAGWWSNAVRVNGEWWIYVNTSQINHDVGWFGKVLVKIFGPPLKLLPPLEDGELGYRSDY